jgi:hypothetical protein
MQHEIIKNDSKITQTLSSPVHATGKAPLTHKTAPHSYSPSAPQAPQPDDSIQEPHTSAHSPTLEHTAALEPHISHSQDATPAHSAPLAPHSYSATPSPSSPPKQHSRSLAAKRDSRPHSASAFAQPAYSTWLLHLHLATPLSRNHSCWGFESGVLPGEGDEVCGGDGTASRRRG